MGNGLCSTLIRSNMYMGGEDRLGRIQRNVGQDGETAEQTSTSTVYYCQEHGAVVGDKTCQDQFAIGWVTDTGDYIAKGIPMDILPQGAIVIDG